jgi:hypothetical protein
MYSGLRHEDRRNTKIRHLDARRRRAMTDNFTRNQAWRMKVAILKFPGGTVGDIPNGYTNDVVLNQQAKVAHEGGMADCLPGGPVAGKPMAVLDAGVYGGSRGKPMAGYLVVHNIV